MPYESVDKLQKVLTERVFSHCKDAKKAAGRALGTIVEIITYHVLNKWGYGDLILRNAARIADSKDKTLIANLALLNQSEAKFVVSELLTQPFAIVECKRVGVEEGAKKGPQTIEKAKQGAYVAKAISAMQKIRDEKGNIYGVMPNKKGGFYFKPYGDFLDEIIASNDPDLLSQFILTVGVTSNHGNWFTSDDHNKEMKVLTQSYDWLLFLSDSGISEFVEDLILKAPKQYKHVKDAFLKSYAEDKRHNQFTKVKMNYLADQELRGYFGQNIIKIEKWFNVIGPPGRDIKNLRKQLSVLSDKSWFKHIEKELL